MNDVLLAKIASVGSGFLLWHFLSLTLCLTGLLLEKFTRKSNPRVRSTLLRLTLVVSLAVPVVCSILNSFPAAVPTPVQSVHEKTEPAFAQQTLSNFPAIDWDRVAVWRPIIADVGQLQVHLVKSTSFGPFLMEMVYAALLGISSLVSFYLLVSLVFAVCRCTALRRRGIPLEASAEAKCKIMAATMGVSAPQVLRVDGLESPLLLGFFRSVILLPDGIQARDEIYGHELTHLRRHDMWWHLFARLGTIFMPLQPGFWLLKKAMERADEDVCDDMVLVQGANRSAYAELLLTVAESQHSPCPDLCLPMAAFQSQLEHRLHRLMDTTRPLADRISLSSLSFCLGPLVVVGFLTGAIYLDAERPLQAAEEKPASTMTEVEAKKQGIAAVVNGQLILWQTVYISSEVSERALKANYSGNDLHRAIVELRKTILQSLIDRELILEDFKLHGGFIPKAYVNARVDDDIKNLYDGDKTAFLNSLADRHVTLESFKQEIEDNAVVGYMRGVNVDKKLRTFYADHLDLFPQDEQLNVTMIELRGDLPALSDQTGNHPAAGDHQGDLAHQIVSQLNAGADATALAKKYNVDTEFQGNAIWVTKDGEAGLPSWWPVTWDEVEKLKPGQTTDVAIGYGDFIPSDGISREYPYYYIVRLNQRIPARMPVTPETTEKKKSLLEAERQKIQTAWLDGLRAKSQTQIFKTATPVLTGYIDDSPATPLGVVALPTSNYPKGIAVLGKKGFVKSPYALYAEPIDVHGYSPGTFVRCPYTNKIFVVPEN